MLQHQRLNRKGHVKELLCALAFTIWCAYWWTHPGQPIHVEPPIPSGAPGTTVTDWIEGTTSNDSPELHIDTEKLKLIVRRHHANELRRLAAD